MLFNKINDNTNLNLGHISKIYLDGTNIIYESAKGSLDGYRENFETEEEAQARFKELQSDLLI